MAEIDALLVRIDATTESLRRQLQQGEARIGQFENNVNGRLAKINRSFDALSAGATRLLAVFGGVQAARGFIDLLDTTNRLQQRLANVTKGSDDLRAVQQRLFDVSQKTGTSLEGSVELYVRLAQATESLNLGQNRLISLSTAVQQALRISGASTQEASAAVVQLGQALGSGRLQGDELRSLGENANRLIKAIVDGLNQVAPQLKATRGNLRDLGKDGLLTSDLIVRALQSQFDTLNREFSRLPDTLEMAWTRLRNQVLQAIGVMDDGSGATERLANAIDQVRQTVADPAFQEGLNAIGTGIGAIAGAAADAVREIGKLANLFSNFDWGDLGNFLLDRTGPGFAAKMLGMRGATGASGQIQDLIRRRAATEALTIHSPGVGAAWSGNPAGFEAMKRQALAEIDAELRARTAKLFQGAGTTAAQATLPNLSVTGTPPSAPGKAGGAKGKDAFDQVTAAVQRLREEQQRQAEQMLGASRTAWEGYNADLADARALYDGGYLSAAEFARVQQHLTEQFAANDDVVRSATEALKAYDDQQKELAQNLAQVIEDTRTPMEAYRARLTELDGLRAFARQSLDGEKLAEALDAIEREARRANPAFQELERFGEQAFDRIGEAMTQMAVQGGNAWQSLGNIAMGVLSELEQELLRLAVINPIKNSLFGSGLPGLGDVFGALFGGGSGGGINGTGLQAGGMASIQFRAAGGPVSAGMPYIVGERGPELFVPRMPGAIAPNGSFGGAANTNVRVELHLHGDGSQTIDRTEQRTRSDGTIQIDAFLSSKVNGLAARGRLDKGLGTRRPLTQMG